MWTVLADWLASRSVPRPPALAPLDLGADAVIAVAFLGISAGLNYLMYRRRDMAHARIYRLFSLFILAAAATHAMSVWTVWRPDFALETAVKLIAAGLAVGGAVMLWHAMPRLLTMPSNPELERVIAEKTAALGLSEQRFRDFASVQSDWLWETDANLRFTYVSDRVSGVGGPSPPEQFVGENRRPEDIVDADGPVWQAHLADLAAHRPFRNLVYGRRGRDGRVAYSRASGKPVVDAEGNFRGYRGASSDATAEVEAEQRAQRAHALLLDAIESLPAALVLYDRDERLVLYNSRCTEMLPGAAAILVPGRGIEEMMRMTAERQLAGASVEAREAWVQTRLALFRRGRNAVEERLADGRWFQAFDRRTSDGGTVSIRLDITARKQAEEQLREAQKLQAIGQLTGGVAHDFNNLLAVVIGNLELIGDATADRRDLAPMIAAAMRAADRGAAQTQRLLAFARRQPLRPQAIDLNALLRGMDDLLHRSLGAAVEIRSVLAPALWRTMADAGQVESAVLNLAINARDAMPDGGRLTIETQNRHIDQDCAAREPEMVPGDYVVLAVTDTGSGMAPDVAARAFEPFFTTKPLGQGTGLGLSMIYGFAKQSGGHVTICSEPGHGTTVRLYLPRAAEAATAAGDAPGAGGAQRGHETVLAVEDDADVRQVATGLLEDLGYRVLLAEDGPQALAVLEAHPEVDLMFTDIVMPGGMSGIELAAEARRRRPGLKVLYCSGYAEMAVARAGGIDAELELIGKPYRKHELAAKLRRVLGRVATG